MSASIVFTPFHYERILPLLHSSEGGMPLAGKDQSHCPLLEP